MERKEIKKGKRDGKRQGTSSNMKRLLIVVMLFLLPSCLMADGWGDVNQDGKVDETDIADLKNYLMGNPSGNFKVDNADINDDGGVNLADIVALIEYVKERAALMDLYNATDGDHWKNNTNWGSDKPLSEWYGCSNVSRQVYVRSLELSSNNLSGQIPESISGLSYLQNLYLSCNHLSGEIPSSLGDIKSLRTIGLTENQLTGTIPQSVCELPQLFDLDLQENKLSGNFPEYLTSVMDKGLNLSHFNLRYNYFTGKIPDKIMNHPRFRDLWTTFLAQHTELDLSNLVLYAPDFELVDIDGNIMKSDDLYKKNKLTLLYNWESWCNYSLAFNEKLIPAYNQFHEKGFEVVGLSVLCDYASPCHDEETYRAYLKEKSVPWHNVSQTFENWIPILFYCASPSTILVDQSGKIISQNLANGGEDYNQIIPRLEEFFGEKVDYGYYTSTDYSQDGVVVKLQTATTDNTVDLVFVGEAFTDKDMDGGGKYEQKMRAAMEQFFSYEPYTSLRNRFNVYMVKAVSPNEEFSEDARHAIEEDDEMAFSYAMEAVGDNPERLLVGVIYNTESAIDRSYCHMYDGDGSCVAYLMTGIGNVLNHELGGHGIAQLGDEYVEQGNEALGLPEADKAELDELWTNGGAANVDYHSDASEVKWAHFINDPLYSGEVGIYEGAYLYGKGAYRPTWDSMMRYNNTGFNAPSRESIYKHVMLYSEGGDWTYDYDTFVLFDASGREAFGAAQTRNKTRDGEVAKRRMESRPPTMFKGTWHDAGKYELGRKKIQR